MLFFEHFRRRSTASSLLWRRGRRKEGSTEPMQMVKVCSVCVWRGEGEGGRGRMVDVDVHVY